MIPFIIGVFIGGIVGVGLFALVIVAHEDREKLRK